MYATISNLFGLPNIQNVTHRKTKDTCRLFTLREDVDTPLLFGSPEERGVFELTESDHLLTKCRQLLDLLRLALTNTENLGGNNMRVKG